MAEVDEKDVYQFTSSVSQYITVVVTPEYQLDAFSVTLTSGTFSAMYERNLFYSSSANMTTFVNWIQVYAAEPMAFSATVELGFSAGDWDHPFRFFVTGSIQYIPVSNQFSGSYIWP